MSCAGPSSTSNKLSGNIIGNSVVPTPSSHTPDVSPVLRLGVSFGKLIPIVFIIPAYCSLVPVEALHLTPRITRQRYCGYLHHTA